MHCNRDSCAMEGCTGLSVIPWKSLASACVWSGSRLMWPVEV